MASLCHPCAPPTRLSHGWKGCLMGPSYPSPTPVRAPAVPGATVTPPQRRHPAEQPETDPETEPEAEGIREFFHERLFRTNTLSFWVQAAVGCAIGFAIGAALLILFFPELRPTVSIQSNALTIIAPLATVITIRLFWIV